MSRPKLSVVIVIAAFILAALCIVPMMTFAAPSSQSSQIRAKQDIPTTAYYALSATITQGQNKNTPIIGGLTLQIKHSGDFFGKFVEPGKVYINVNGKILSSGSLTINFLQGGTAYMTGQGTFVNPSAATGVFQVSNGTKQVSSGVWSAVSTPGPGSQLSMAFYGRVKTGPDTKLDITGPIILSGTTLKPGITLPGSIDLSDGTILAVRANIDPFGHLEVNLGVGSKTMHVIGVGISFYSKSLLAKGFSGSFVGPKTHDAGTWESVNFSFILP